VIGRAVKTFGVRGEIRVRPFTESFSPFFDSETLLFDDIPKKVVSVRAQKGDILVTIEGVATPEDADGLLGALVKTHRANLPPTEEDEYYWFDLIGMRVFTLDGRDLGEITHITPTGANDVLHVEGAFGEVLLPMIEQVIIEVDTKNRRVLTDPLEGLVPDA
jgi:16S rRNA processing protein RimM